MAETVTDAALTAAAFIETGVKSWLKQAAIFSVALLALICIGSSLRAAEPARDPAGFDILGMKLGMSVEEIQAALRAYNPSLVTGIAKRSNEPVLGVGKVVQFLQAERHPPAPLPTDEYILVGFTVTEPVKAFYIGRISQFPLGQQPLVDSTVKQLGEKYGPASEPPINYGFNWVFNTARKQQFLANPRSYCKIQGALSYGVVIQAASNRSPESFSPDCSITLYIYLNVSGSDAHLVQNITEQLVGNSIAIEDIRKAVIDAKAEQERQRQQQEQKASGVKSPL